MKPFLAKAWVWIKRYLLAPLPALIIVAVALLLVAVGFKDIQIGGLLAKFFGKPEGKKAIDVANSVPDHRVDANGSLILIGSFFLNFILNHFLAGRRDFLYRLIL